MKQCLHAGETSREHVRPKSSRDVLRPPRTRPARDSGMGKRKGRQRDTAFAALTDAWFRTEFYDRHHLLSAALRTRVECEGKARGLRNQRKQRRD